MTHLHQQCCAHGNSIVLAMTQYPFSASVRENSELGSYWLIAPITLYTVNLFKFGSNLSSLSPSDRPWLTDVHKIQKLQEKVYVALQRCLQKHGASEEKLAKVKNLLQFCKNHRMFDLLYLDIYLVFIYSFNVSYFSVFLL